MDSGRGACGLVAKLLASGEVAKSWASLAAPSPTVSRWVRDGWITPAVETAGGQFRFDLDQVREQLVHRLASVISCVWPVAALR